MAAATTSTSSASNTANQSRRTMPTFIPISRKELFNFSTLGLVVVYCDQQIQPWKGEQIGVSEFIYELAGESLEAIMQSILIENSTEIVPLGQAYFTNSGDLACGFGLFHVPCVLSELKVDTMRSSYLNCLQECEQFSVSDCTFTFLNDPDLQRVQFQALEEAVCSFLSSSTTEDGKIEQIYLAFDDTAFETRRAAFEFENTILAKLDQADSKHIVLFNSILFRNSKVSFAK